MDAESKDSFGIEAFRRFYYHCRLNDFDQRWRSYRDRGSHLNLLWTERSKFVDAADHLNATLTKVDPHYYSFPRRSVHR
jgi:hypothetical protein